MFVSIYKLIFLLIGVSHKNKNAHTKKLPYIMKNTKPTLNFTKQAKTPTLTSAKLKNMPKYFQN